MAVRLVDGRTFNVPSDTRVVSKKKALIQTSVVLSSLPLSYHTNTKREQTLLDYSEHFRRQFISLYPSHSPLLLAPLNECAIRKFLTTSIIPLHLPYTDLYDLHGCASFVSDFIAFLPLDDTKQLPDYLPSLTSIVSIRAGDCLDMSTLLCSLLRGDGYNAYVVSGDAEVWVCRGDETRTRCPLLPDDAAERRKRDDEIQRKQQEDRQHNRYLALVPERKPHQSKFITARQIDALRPHTDDNNITTSSDPSDSERKRKQAHAWVLVLPGRREVQSALFVEASTGAMYDVKSEHPYVEVSAVWNEENVWVNVQEGKRTVREMGLDLSNATHWLRVIEQRQAGKNEREKSEGDDDDGDHVEEEKESVLTSSSSAPAKQPLLLPASWVAPVTITRDQWQQRYPHGSKTIHYLHCKVEKFSPYLTHTRGAVLRIEQLDPITSLPLCTEERYQHRKDKLESRVTDHAAHSVVCVYEKGVSSGLREYRVVSGVRREFVFWSGSRVDGMVRRVEEVERKVVEEYEDRDDRLIYRSITVDRSSQYQQQRQKPFTITIATSVDLPIRKLTEKYRPDPALHPEVDVVKRSHLLLEGLILLRYACCKDRLEGSLQVIDKNDKLESTDSVTAGAGGAAVAAGAAATTGTIGAAAGAAGVTGGAPAVNGGASGGSRARLDRKTRGWKEMTRGEEQVMMGRLLIVEKELKVKVKEREARMTELVAALDAVEDSVELVENIYDAAYHAALHQHQHHHTLDTDDNTSTIDAMSLSSNDYLTPFLLPFSPSVPLTRKQAEQVRASCLTALKERLLSRANIIQQHLEDEQAKLASRQVAFKRQAGSGSIEANDEFQKFSESCLFRIDILVARRARHEQMAVKKYLEMEQQLNRDARLAALHSAE